MIVEKIQAQIIIIVISDQKNDRSLIHNNIYVGICFLISIKYQNRKWKYFVYTCTCISKLKHRKSIWFSVQVTGCRNVTDEIVFNL